MNRTELISMVNDVYFEFKEQEQNLFQDKKTIINACVYDVNLSCVAEFKDIDENIYKTFFDKRINLSEDVSNNRFFVSHLTSKGHGA